MGTTGPPERHRHGRRQADQADRPRSPGSQPRTARVERRLWEEQRTRYWTRPSLLRQRCSTSISAGTPRCAPGPRCPRSPAFRHTAYGAVLHGPCRPRAPCALAPAPHHVDRHQRGDFCRARRHHYVTSPGFLVFLMVILSSSMRYGLRFLRRGGGRRQPGRRSSSSACGCGLRQRLSVSAIFFLVFSPSSSSIPVRRQDQADPGQTHASSANVECR